MQAGLALLAGFFLGMHPAVVLHELGHALGSWCGGRPVTAIVMFTPFPAGYVLPAASDCASCVWGGVAFGTAAAILPLALAARLRTRPALRYVMLLVAAFCLLHNGVYLVAGSIAPYADAAHMIELGASRWLLFLLGLPLLVGFVLVLQAALSGVGLSAEDSLAAWIVTVEAGLLPCPAVMVAILALSPNAASMRLPMVILLVLFASCFGIAAARARSAARIGVGGEGVVVRGWSSVLALLGAAVMLVAVEGLAFRHG